MSAIEKTNKLERKEIPVGDLKPAKINPNTMKDKEFDLLIDNIEKVGITDPVLVRPDGEKFRIIGGHHRWKAAQYLNFKTVPCTVIDDPDFDEEAEQAQLIRHNVIHGSMDPEQFMNLYYEFASKYPDDVIQETFGFADQKEFQKLINQAAKSLPKEMQGKFKEAAKELKTVDDLANLLNKMFTKYGDTLPFGYMVVDYGGKESVWLRVTNPTYKALDVIADVCIENRRTMDDVIGTVLQKMAKGDLKELVQEVIENSPEVDLPSGLQTKPTKDNIEAYGELEE